MSDSQFYENQFLKLSEWFPGAVGVFGPLMLALILMGVVFGYLVAAFRHGAGEGFYIVAQTVGGFFPDWLRMSPRRVWAIARLAIKEAFRRRVVMVTFGLFALAILFGGWFMNSNSDHPDRIYVNFVAFGTQMLVLFMGILVASFSLPDDIKNKTIYTVVTKPVRASEIVVGRIVGFTAIGTALLTLMGIVSFVFVWGGLTHTHQIVGENQSIASFEDIDPTTRLNQLGRRVSNGAIKTFQTTMDDGHRHTGELIEDIRDADSPPMDASNVVSKEVLPNGQIKYRRVIVDLAAGHTHGVKVSGDGDNATITLGPARGFFRARVPYYSDSLAFFEYTGARKEGGVDVGRELNRQGFFDGGTPWLPNTLSRAEFDFSGIVESRFEDPNLVVLEMNLGVFRTTKANIQKRVLGSWQIESVPENPEEGRVVSERFTFESQEYQTQLMPIKRKIVGQKTDESGNFEPSAEFDLFDDYAKNGKLKLVLRCEDPNQYLGAARADVYFRSADQPYAWNFFKSYLGIWAQMLVIISLGVAFSTFLNAPVTIVMTAVTMLVGFNTEFIREMLSPDHVGGGPLESFYRIVTQNSMVLELDPGIGSTLLEKSDQLLVQMLASLTYIAPNFSIFNFSESLIYGYDISLDRLGVAFITAFAFFIGFSILGYFSLKTREIAK